MPKDQDLVTLNGDLKSTGAGTDTGLDEPLNAMGDLFSEAVQGLMFQNVGMVDTTVRTAKSLYDDIKKYASQEELLLPEILKETICLYAPLTRTLVFMAKGRLIKPATSCERNGHLRRRHGHHEKIRGIFLMLTMEYSRHTNQSFQFFQLFSRAWMFTFERI